MVKDASSRAAMLLLLAAALLLVAPAQGNTQDPAAANRLELIEHVLADNVVEREPVGVADRFSTAHGRVYSFVRLANPGPPTAVTFHWYRDGREHAVIELEVGTSPGWRTWTSVTALPGRWRVVVAEVNGAILDERFFEIDE